MSEPSVLDKASVVALCQHAQALVGRTMAEAVPGLESQVNKRNKGDLGSIVERYYFEHEPPDINEPDFDEAGLELKVTGVIQKRDGNLRAKERLVLTMINYDTIVDETWETSKFLSKCRLMLILFYEYDKAKDNLSRRFVLEPVLHRLAQPMMWPEADELQMLKAFEIEIPIEDLNTIRRDWETIQATVKLGLAHELSEGDTTFLGACRKGSGGSDEPLRRQPFSKQRAKARAFSLKPAYVNRLINGVVLDSGGVRDESPAPAFPRTSTRTFEESVLDGFKTFLGLTLGEAAKNLGYRRPPKGYKGFHREVARRILLGGAIKLSALDIKDIEMKTIRVNKDWKPREAMSFPNFKYLEIVNERWEDSSFCVKLEKRFLFVVFRTDELGVERLAKVFYWNMPYQDRREARRVWLRTKKCVAKDARCLPTSSDSHVAHVRPKARNSGDRELTPQGAKLVRKCFWLNRDYIASVLKDA